METGLFGSCSELAPNEGQWLPGIFRISSFFKALSLGVGRLSLSYADNERCPLALRNSRTHLTLTRASKARRAKNQRRRSVDPALSRRDDETETEEVEVKKRRGCPTKTTRTHSTKTVAKLLERYSDESSPQRKFLQRGQDVPAGVFSAQYQHLGRRTPDR